MRKKGIAVAGNMMLHMVCPVHGLPQISELAHITANASRAVGGHLCNDILDLAILDPRLPLTALGRVGRDEAGDFILGKLRARPNICLDQVRRHGATSYTLEMVDADTGQHAFCHCRGANAGFCETDIDWNALDVSILHIGSILLLDALDAPDGECGTKMARLLRTAQQRGIQTSVDVCAAAGERRGHLVAPALRYADYCIVSAAAAQVATGMCLLSRSDSLCRGALPAALRALKAQGVSRWAIIHTSEGAFGLDERDNYFELPGLALPDEAIKGELGARDAFSAGVLYAAWRGMPLPRALEAGAAAALCSLSEPGATEGMRPYADAMALYRAMRAREQKQRAHRKDAPMVRRTLESLALALP